MRSNIIGKPLCPILFFVLMIFLCSPIALAVEKTPPPLIAPSSGITVNYMVNSGYKWQYDPVYSKSKPNAYKAGNSGTKTANVSNIALTVTKPGILSFDYKISTGSIGDSYGLYYRLGQAITGANYMSSDNYNEVNSYRGQVQWTHKQIIITPKDLVNGKATLYIAYFRGGTGIANDNKVAIANIGFISGNKQLLLKVAGSEYGKVTGAETGENSFLAGTKLKLTAQATDGNRFYGWINSGGRFISSDPVYAYTVASDAALTAVFAPNGTYAARRNGQFYTVADGGLAKALADAKPNDNLMLLENQTLSANAMLPLGATLYIPYDESYDRDGSADGMAPSGDILGNAAMQIADQSKLYRMLTIDPGVNLTVKGSLIVGSVIGYPAMNGYQGHSSGPYGCVQNNGNIILENGAKLDSYGIVNGIGTVNARSGSKVYEPFIVVDFVGGSNTSQLYLARQAPFRHWAIQNVQNKLILEAGSQLFVHCNLYAGGVYSKNDIAFISTNGLFRVGAKSRVIRTYDGS
ncbi:MAG: hypothetical protein RR396_03275, partial [Clostridiales bacterium]